MQTNSGLPGKSSHLKNSSDSESWAADMYNFDNRSAVRRQSYNEMIIFRNRWKKAIHEDKCWIDPFKRQSHMN
ncbi:hypothetical protein CDL12_08612 [Handroanthus impetiginosus]|uniref:Uncharacterized protein n=1 Tax=Handroanthus impetiginosus TaxID=429701 RepID=A0A2G9HN51_9LAMI|nr:hypothetical protein CDL12_08612 [Handroanthus impetiginosus]